MRIAIDVQPLMTVSKDRGIGRHTGELIKHILMEDDENEYIFFNPYGENTFLELLDIDKKYFEKVSTFNIYFGKNNLFLDRFQESKYIYDDWFSKTIQKFIWEYEIDVFFVPSPCDAIINFPCNAFENAKLVTTAYDLIPALFPKEYLNHNEAYKKIYFESLNIYKHSDRVVCISEQIKKDFHNELKIANDVLTTIYCGESDLFKNKASVNITKGYEKVELFTWGKAARKHIDIFEEMKRTKKAKRKLKVAMFSPLPPIQSGISDYTVDILNSIEPYFEIDVIIDDYNAKCKLSPSINIINHKKFEPEKYDRIVYQMGNSVYHYYMYEYIRKYSGIVVLHDGNLHSALLHFYKGQITEEYKKDLHLDYEDISYTQGNTKMMVNGYVTKYAEKVIVHSKFAKKTVSSITPVNIIPLYTKIEPIKATDSYNLNAEDIVIASYGMVQSTKRIMQTTRAIYKLIKENPDKNIKYLVVGKYNYDDKLELDMKKFIKKNRLENKIQVTGYTKLKEFENLMDRADIAVNLRYPYNGETSAALMRLVGKGNAIITTDVGSFGELPDDVVIKLPIPEHGEDDEIQNIYVALKKLIEDDEYRKNLGRRARKFAEEKLDIKIIAKQYKKSIESEGEFNISYERLMPQIIKELCKNGDNGDLRTEMYNISKSIAFLSEKEECGLVFAMNQPRIIYNITACRDRIKTNHITGIERVVWNLFLQLEKMYSIIPVIDCIDGDDMELFEVDRSTFSRTSKKVKLQSSDIIFYPEIYSSLKQNYRWKLKNLNTKVSIVYDILPLLNRKYFNEDMYKIFSCYIEEITSTCDYIITISETVKKELIGYVKENNIKCKAKQVIDYVHVGVDKKVFVNTEPSNKVKSAFIEKEKSFLMLGTVEIRKNHANVLTAFENMWAQGEEFKLCIIGRRGWKAEDLFRRIENHPLLGEKLFFFEAAPDADVDYALNNATALIQASFGEGFGLPLIEAGNYNLPILCSDIPVFREVAGENAVYFNPHNVEDIEEKILRFNQLYDNNEHPQSKNIKYNTWEDMAKEIDAKLKRL